MKQPDWTIKDVILLKENYYSATTEELLEMFVLVLSVSLSLDWLISPARELGC